MKAETEDKIALIDLDGTVADYDAAMTAAMRALQSPEERPYEDRYGGGAAEPLHLEARRKVIQRQSGFWRKLRPIPVGFEVVAEMRAIGFTLHVLTKGPRASTNAWSEKVEWCAEHLPDAAVTITGDKSLVYGRVLLDDYPPYFEGWLTSRPRGLVVCVAHAWNADYAAGGSKEHPNVLRYDGDPAALPALRRRLAYAYERSASTV